jgi:prepilin-type N-terminal cleavage/methylation domain-containing protein
MRRRGGFTLIEITISVFILLMLLLLAVPSLSGVLADRRLRRSLDDFNNLVRTAQERSVKEHRPYLIVWNKDNLALRPEAAIKDEEDKPSVVFRLRRGDAFKLNLPAALVKNPAAQWVFWPSGNCEPAVVAFKGVDGSWTANYSPLSGRPQITQYAAR